MILQNGQALWLLFLVPCVVIPFFLWGFMRKARMIRLFAQSNLLPVINLNSSLKREVTKAILLTIGFIFIVIALTEPAWNPKPTSINLQGRDIVVLLDVSRSMLAEDIRPSRLEMAKIAIKDLLDSLNGDRVAIITFAGTTSVKCPLTNDYGFLKMVVDNEINVESVPVGGTNLGDAIRYAAGEIFEDSPSKYRDMIVISDGEDNQATFPQEAAKQAGEKGLRIIAIGLGSQNPGARIPIYENGQKRFLMFDGKEVWTKLTAESIINIASATTGGRYLIVEPNQTFALDELYKDIAAGDVSRELGTAASIEYDKKFQLFLILALIFIIGEVLVAERKKI